MTELTATTSNYLTVAAFDDQDAQAPMDKAEVRRQRIEAAVERSKHEYKAEHAYTERAAGPRSSSGVKPKIDRQQLEFLVSSLYYNEEYSRALQLLLDALDESKKSMGGLSRELIDTGIRSALKAGDTQNAWKSQFAGIATASADAFIAAGFWQESLQPLLVSTAAFGLHEPVLSRLSLVITTLNQEGSLDALLAAVDAVKAKQKYSLQRPFFAWNTTNAVTPAHLAPTTVNLDYRVIASALGIDDAHLQKTLSRLEKAMGGSEEESQTERGVREL